VALCAGEGFVGENGVDLSFEAQDFMSFGVIVLKDGKVWPFQLFCCCCVPEFCGRAGGSARAKKR
jgi:hypothetical protein